ncbi:MAG: type IV secretion system protein [Acidobacteria bacterium]|nr:type IV secretion system protein [Acidobacteriota bacterium]
MVGWWVCLGAAFASGAAVLVAQTPPPPIPIDPDGGATRWAFAYVEAAMNDLINDPLGGSFGAVTIREYFHDLGMRLWGMIGLIMVVMQGLRMSAGARFDIWDVIRFLLWIGFPLLLLESFYTPYAIFGNQTFLQVVVGQGQELAAALNGPGGAFGDVWESLTQVFGRLWRASAQSVTSMSGRWGIFSGLINLLAAIGATLASSLIVLVTVVILLIAVLIVYAQVVWANVAIGLLSLIGPVFIPFLLVEQLNFLFWSWFKGLLQYSFQVVVAALLLRVIAALSLHPIGGMLEFVERIGGLGAVENAEPLTVAFEQIVVQQNTWIPVILAALLMSFKVAELTQVMLTGMGNMSSGLTGLAAAAATTVATGGAALATGAAGAGLGALSNQAAAHGLKGTARALGGAARMADSMHRRAGGRKGDEDG